MACSIEYLLPCSSYMITTDESQVGIIVGKELPLRVMGFKTVSQDAHYLPGPAERTGRVRVGDLITSVDGQDISGLSRSEALKLITNQRPVTLGFTVASDDFRRGTHFSPLKYFGGSSRSSTIGNI